MIYRLHVTCPAGHKTYWDYKTMRSAKRNLEKYTDKTTWYGTHIETFVSEHWEKVNGLWQCIKILKTEKHK